MAKMANEKSERQRKIENIERSCICWDVRTVRDDGKLGELLDFGLFDHDKDKRQGKIKPGPQWAQRCFADNNNPGREVDVCGECVECPGISHIHVEFELPDCDCDCGWWRRLVWWIWWGVIGWGQWVATVLAVGGVLLNNARIRWCFPVWFVSNIICLVYHVRAKLWGMAVRDVVFIGLAVAGWF